MMKKKKVTLKDIARKAGVSTTTVSMVLNGNRSFPEETCQKIIDTANELKYEKSKTSSFLAGTGSEKVLAVVVPTLKNPCFVQTIQAMQRQAKKTGYTLMIFDTSRGRTQEACVIRICNTYPFSGVILCYPPENNTELRQLEESKPVFHIYDKGVYHSESYLALDGVRLGDIVARHLISLGHERIAFLCLDFEPKQVTRSRRLEGLRAVYKENGFDPDEAIVLCTPKTYLNRKTSDLDGYELGYELTKAIIEKNEPVTALACLNDMLAIGAIDALIDAGKSVPEDYSVCGCDNNYLSKFKRISLTTVETFNTQSGKFAIDFITRRIENNDIFSGDEDVDHPDSVIQLEYIPKLIVRSTTGVAKKRNHTT